MTTILLIIVATTLVLSQTEPVLATVNATTRINTFTATESGGLVTITGVLQYIDSSGNYQPLINSKIIFYWWNTATGNVESNYVGEVYSNDKSAAQPGGFAYNWQDGLEPGNYYLKGVYTANGASWSGYTFQNCMDDTPFSVSLILQVSLNNPTISLTQGGSVSLTVSVGTLNSKNPHPVTLSATSSSQLFASLGFTPTLGNAPFTSTLSLNVLNVTQPGTYSMIITATSNEDSSVAATTPLFINVQQDTYMIKINVEGLNSDAVTPLYVDGTFIENIGTGSVTLTISNQARQISVQNQINSGDTLYACLNFTQSTDVSVTGLTFTYLVSYKLQLMADLPPKIVSNLTLKVNGADRSNPQFQVSKGFGDYLPRDATVQFAITPSYINTTTLNYKFTGWSNPITGQVMKNANASGGLFQVILNNPMTFIASFDRFVMVTVRANLPSGMSAQLQVGLVGGDTRAVTVAGSQSQPTGEYLVGSMFQCDIADNMLVLVNAKGDTRYEFQGFNPSLPITLRNHTTIAVNYSPKYRVRALSTFPDTILQPAGGVAWLGAGEIATIQAKPDASDNGLPYLFDHWSGAVSSNSTQLVFPVARPVDVVAEWKFNITYFLAIMGGAIGLLTASALIIRRTITNHSLKKKIQKKSIRPIQPIEDLRRGLSDDDMKIYDYIVAHSGMLKYSECMKDLGYDRKQVDRSIENLKGSHMLS